MLDTVLAKSLDIFINLISAVIIILIGVIIGRALGRVLTKLLGEIELNSFVLNELRVNLHLEEYLGALVSYICYAASILLALDALGITTPIFYLVLGGAVVLIILSLMVGIRDFFPNLRAGIRLMRGRSFREGERIVYEGTTVRVKQIGFLETRMETRDGDVLFVPNSEIMKKRIKNLTVRIRKMRKERQKR